MLRILGALAFVSSGAILLDAYGGGGCAYPAVGLPAFDEQVAALRSAGPAGLEAALRQFDGAANEDERWSLSQLVDQVAGQRNATVSRLFWYVDLEQAKRTAADSGKPILSLRLLGKLTDESSCANSRFFRTALYANTEVSDYLRNNFILHWQSIRPVPRITVDFGDGRKLERTITGNSAHYALDADGQPLDALPGLYGPQAFGEWLKRVKTLADKLATNDNADRFGQSALLQQYHADRQAAIEHQLRQDLTTVAPELLNPDDSEGPSALTTISSTNDANQAPTAAQAAAVAVSKTIVKANFLEPFTPSEKTLQEQDDSFWLRVADLHADEATLDQSSRMLMARKVPHPMAETAARAAMSKFRVEYPLLRLTANFERSMAIDAVKNEYVFHRTIHQWFVDGTAPADVDALNERVYAELFLTPSSDPWLGLAPTDVYAALDDGGLTEPAFTE